MDFTGLIDHEHDVQEHDKNLAVQRRRSHLGNCAFRVADGSVLLKRPRGPPFAGRFGAQSAGAVTTPPRAYLENIATRQMMP
jgi:hypothetical protein